MEKRVYKQPQHKIELEFVDPDALEIIHKLKREGHDAYLVGGSVRDLLLGRHPKDFDISTSAKPEEIKALFANCLLIGKRFRLAHLRFHKKIIEVSTFRRGDNQDDSLIVNDNVWGSEEEDVLRRDFTINGLFYDPEKEVIIDYVGGMQDLQKGIIRVIGDPFVRFKQDPVRMLRLIKFKARLGFTIEDVAQTAMIDLREELEKSSKVRTLEELIKTLLLGCSEKFFRLLLHYGYFPVLFPHLYEMLHSPFEDEIMTFFAAVDREILIENASYPRCILLSCLLYPLFHNYIVTLSKTEKTPLHLGTITEEAKNFIRHAIGPFFRLSRKLGYEITIILTSQFRFTPLTPKKHLSYKIPHISEFAFAMQFFELRANIDPIFQEIFQEWQYYYKKHKKRPRKKRGCRQ